MIYPRKITSLRHVWTHPDLPDREIGVRPADIAASEAWLRDFCARSDCPGYDKVMQAINGGWQNGNDDAGGNDGDYVWFHGWDAHGAIPKEFWAHAEIVLGKKLEHAEYFSCSC